MGLTTNGLPYAEPTDSVDYARDSKAAAEAVNVTYDSGSWRLAADQIVATSTFAVLNATVAQAVAAGAFTNASGAVTVLKSGTYEVTVQARWDGYLSGRRFIGVTRNTASIDAGGALSGGAMVTSLTNTPGHAGTWPQVLRSARIVCAANDVLRAFVFHDAGSPLGIRIGNPADYLGPSLLSVMRVAP